MAKKSKIRKVIEKYEREIESLHDRIAILDQIVSELRKAEVGDKSGT